LAISLLDALFVTLAVAARYSEASASRLTKPPRSGFRSAEGRSEGEAAMTDSIAHAFPKSAKASKSRQNLCQALYPLVDKSNNTNKINNLIPKNIIPKAANQFRPIH
jgi:hypothetical protein